MENKENRSFSHINSGRRFLFGPQSSANKVNQAVQFLSSPDIRNITTDATKAKFLKTRGLNQSEITEAFRRHYAVHEPIICQHSSQRLTLQPVANEHFNDVAAVVAPEIQTSNALSKFFNFCQKLVIFAGMASSFYFAYQQWTRARDTKKKTEKSIKDELNQIRNELAKISSELRGYQLMERNQANLLAEINSLKAILVGRQFFDEKPPAKVTLPSWQLNNKQTSKVAEKSVETIAKNEITQLSGQMNGVAKPGSEPKTDDSIPVRISVLTEDESVPSNATKSCVNGDDQTIAVSNRVDSNESMKSAPKSNGIESSSQSKKTDKKN